MFVISAFADEYSASFDMQLQGLKENDVHYIELRNIDKVNVSEITDAHLQTVKDQLARCEVKVSAIGSPLGKVNADCDMNVYMRKVERVCQIAQAVDCSFIRVFSFYRPDLMLQSDYKTAVFEGLEKMLQVAQRYGKTLCLENEAGLYGESPNGCLEILQHFGGDMKCVFDMGNFRLQGYEPFPQAYALLKDYIAYFHIKDSFDHGAIVPAGCGDAKIKEILTAFQSDFAGDYFVSLEPHLTVFDSLNTLTPAKLEHQYVYESKAAAFADAANKLRGLIE